MERNNDKVDLIYIDKVYFYKFVFCICILATMISSLNYVKIEIKGIVEVYYLIINLVIILLVFSIKKVYEHKFYKYVAVIFIIMSSTNIYKIILEDVWKFSNQYFIHTLRIMILLIGLDTINSYLNNFNSTKKNIYKILLSFVVLIILIWSKELLILWLITSAYAIKIKLDTPKLKNNLNINYIHVYLNLFLIRNIIIILNDICINNVILLYLAQYFTILAESLLMICLIYKIINLPYGKIENELREVVDLISYLNEDLKLTNQRIVSNRIFINNIEKTFKSLFRNIPVPTLMINLNKNNIVYANKQCLELFGEEKILDLVGVNFHNLIDLIDNENINYVENESNIGIIKKNNKKVTIEVKDRSLEQGEAIIILTDLTAKPNYLDIENIIVEKKLQEDIKRNFLSNISHDLKTPINVIYSSAQVQDIFINNKNKKELENHMNISKQNYLVLKRLTNNIIDVGKIDSGALKCNLKKGNIVYFVEDVFSSIVSYAKEENIEMQFDTEEEEIYIKFNNDFMERIIINLISNSIKYNKEIGKIFVDIKTENNYVYIIIRDTGIGIKKEFLDKIFERYSKDKKTKKTILKSSGIGMYVVKNLIEAQKGEISIESEEGIGTEIVMRFIREN
ncbi:PAS domain-containing sensor histidine kinase [Clostridium thermobutyricum]|uniref:PAS domain-containing sensor histidine kinase n=1 Tax=Clostridium thermobutyricum TaxID=29372 RepID=UPI0018AC6849|nr:PAS domain-containing sensor histidine kinase [Clostridium thermobutyricum]